MKRLTWDLEETSITKLAKLLIKLSRKEVKVIYKEPRRGDIKRSYADIRKAEKILGFKPKISLEHGLKNLFFEMKEKAD